jgi:magnesium-protoporphyrin O-methyltransferase
MQTASYRQRRGQIEHYFDRTAARAWETLTSTAPVGRIRATVRAGRDRMRDTLLGWLPDDLDGARILDAGCGTGAFAIEAARRGARVLAIDLSPSLVDVARRRIEALPDATSVLARIDLRSGDMLDAALGDFDHAVAMDSLIHYPAEVAVSALSRIAERVRGSVLFTYAPRTPLLAAMISVGRCFPRGDRAPWIEPVATAHLEALVAADPVLGAGTIARTERVASGFYTSQAAAWRRA